MFPAKLETPKMRSRAEIKNKIEELMQIRDASRKVESESLRLHRQNLESQIRALMYALGYEIQPRFWCTACNLSHENIRCPQCGNEAISTAEKELGSDLIEIEAVSPVKLIESRKGVKK